MNNYILFDKVIINGRKRNLYKKKPNAKTIYIKKNNEMVRYNIRIEIVKTNIKKSKSLRGGGGDKNKMFVVKKTII